jgi:hypothetical protein
MSIFGLLRLDVLMYLGTYVHTYFWSRHTEHLKLTTHNKELAVYTKNRRQQVFVQTYIRRFIFPNKTFSVRTLEKTIIFKICNKFNKQTYVPMYLYRYCSIGTCLFDCGHHGVVVPVVVGWRWPVRGQDEHEQNDHDPEDLAALGLVRLKDVDDALDRRVLGVVTDDLEPIWWISFRP